MRALIIVDVQNDFLPGGALAVPQGDEIIPVINGIVDRYDLVVATQDWHPANHGSFAANQKGAKGAKGTKCEIGDVIELDGLPQILWPVHCVQGSPGAEFPDSLDRTHITRVFTKGSNPLVDSYSGFFDNGQRESTGLADYLRSAQVTEVHIVGLATDYCVKFTALDALSLGLKTVLIEDACRGVELQPGDVARAVDEMRSAGIVVTRADQVEVSPEAGNETSADEVIAAGRFLSLVRRGRWEFAHRHNASAVVVVVATEGDQVLIVEQQRVPAGGAVLELPAGLAGDEGDPEESTLRAAKRELLEETGYVAKHWQALRVCFSSPGLTDESLSYYWAKDLTKEGQGGGVGDENIICHWAPIDALESWLDEQQQRGLLVSNLIPAGVQMMCGRALQ